MGRLKTTYRMPLDVIIEILVWLPAKSALRFMSVCKEWCNLINSPFFAKLHLNKSLQPDSQQNHALVFTHSLGIIDDLYHPSRWTKLDCPKDDTIRDNDNRLSRKVVGSCNGLVCFKVFVVNNHNFVTVRYFLICNPTTRSFKSILPSSEKKWGDDNKLSYGFGYDSEHDDYKIVITSTVWTDNDRDNKVLIFSLKANLWSCPPPSPSPPRVTSRRIWINRKRVIFRDKMLHYLAETEDEGRSDVSKDYRIACFDVVSEKWRDDIYFPAELKKDPLRFRELDGWLYLHGGNSKSEIWMLEEDGSWKILQIARNFRWYRLIAGSKDGRNRLLIEDHTGYSVYKKRNVLFWYDRREKRRIPFEVEPSPLYASVRPYHASLVAIPGCSLTKLQEVKE